MQEFKEVCSQLASVGVKIENEKLVQILLNGFLESYESFVQGLSTLTTLLTFEQIIGKLLHEEEWKVLKTSTWTDEAFFWRPRGTTRTRHWRIKALNATIVVRLVALPNNARSWRNKEMWTITRRNMKRIENEQVLLFILLNQS